MCSRIGEFYYFFPLACKWLTGLCADKLRGGRVSQSEQRSPSGDSFGYAACHSKLCAGKCGLLPRVARGGHQRLQHRSCHVRLQGVRSSRIHHLGTRGQRQLPRSPQLVHIHCRSTGLRCWQGGLYSRAIRKDWHQQPRSEHVYTTNAKLGLSQTGSTLRRRGNGPLLHPDLCSRTERGHYRWILRRRRIPHPSHLLRRHRLHISLFYRARRHCSPCEGTAARKTVSNVDHDPHHLLLRQSLPSQQGSLCATNPNPGRGRIRHCRYSHLLLARPRQGQVGEIRGGRWA